MHSIRPAEPNDAYQISVLVCTLADALLVDPKSEEAQSFYAVMQPARIASNMMKEDRFYLVAEVADEIVGMILVLNHNYIGQFFVHGPHQGQGIGSALWRAVLSRAEHAGYDGAFTVKSSVRAAPVYQRFGFEATGVESVDAGFRFIPMSRGAQSAA
jgi:GNAT superfamily N-acetyltransferase